MFKRTEGGLIQARKKLSGALSAGLEGGGDHVTATRVWLDRPDWPVFSGHDEDIDEPGFLEKLADLEEHVGQLPASMEVVGEIMEEMNSVTTEIGERVEKANSTGAPASARLALADELARRLTPHSERLEETALEFTLAVEKVDPGVRHILKVEPTEEAEEQAVGEFRKSLDEALPPVRQYIQSAQTLAGHLQDTGEISRSLRKVNSRTRAALARLVATSERLLEWGDLLSG